MKYLSEDITLEFVVEKCTSCGKCIEVCPRAVFAKVEKLVKVVNKEMCIECGACMRNCAFDAVRVSPGTGCAEAIIKGWWNNTEPDCGDCC
jgi:NAD-dependent dihydropyrimidine dehydrogenase PreA subunit